MYHDKELDEDIEVNQFNPFGFCYICGEPAFHPRKFELLMVCNNCIKDRMDEIVKRNKVLKNYLEKPKEQEEK